MPTSLRFPFRTEMGKDNARTQEHSRSTERMVMVATPMKTAAKNYNAKYLLFF